MLREDYKKASKGSLAVTILGCILGGGICMFLGFLGSFGDANSYQTIVQSGFTLSTVICYAIVVVCGFGVLFRIPCACMTAALVIMIEFGIYCAITMKVQWSVHFLMMIKFAVFVCCSQLLVSCLTSKTGGKTVRYVEPEGVPQAHVRQQYQQQAPVVDNVAASRGCSVPRAASQQRGGVPQPRGRMGAAVPPKGAPQPRRR